MVVRFSPADLELFAAASHDRNPLHLSAAYARRTPYGREVVFGILGALACLRAVDPVSVSRLSFEFLRPLFPDTDYDIAFVESDGATRGVELRDGSSVIVRSSITIAATSSAVAWGEMPKAAMRKEPLDGPEPRAGDRVAGDYVPDRDALRSLMNAFRLADSLAAPVTALLLSSYLVGMELPGKRALFFKVSFDFTENGWEGTQPVTYAAEVLSVNAYNLLRATLALSTHTRVIASGEVHAFIRAGDDPQPEDEMLPQGQDLAGKVALVIGGSRGLGASVTRALLRQGCTVLVNYHHSEEEARKLPREAILVPGDARSLESCSAIERMITARHGRLDILVCNACPPPLPFRLEGQTVQRINGYIGEAIAMADVPMAVFLDGVAKACGWCVVISSAYVEEAPKDLPHYVAVKHAVEGLARVAALQYRQASVLIVRAPRMLTDMTRSAFGNQRALQPGTVAARITERVRGEKSPGVAQTMSWGETVSAS